MTLEQRAADIGINEFTGYSNANLRAQVRYWETRLKLIDQGEGGGGSPREFPLERIADIEAELERRANG